MCVCVCLCVCVCVCVHACACVASLSSIYMAKKGGYLCIQLCTYSKEYMNTYKSLLSSLLKLSSFMQNFTFLTKRLCHKRKCTRPHIS